MLFSRLHHCQEEVSDAGSESKDEHQNILKVSYTKC